MRGPVDCGECRTDGCPEGKCQRAIRSAEEFKACLTRKAAPTPTPSFDVWARGVDGLYHYDSTGDQIRLTPGQVWWVRFPGMSAVLSRMAVLSVSPVVVMLENVDEDFRPRITASGEPVAYAHQELGFAELLRGK